LNESFGKARDNATGRSPLNLFINVRQIVDKYEAVGPLHAHINNTMLDVHKY